MALSIESLLLKVRNKRRVVIIVPIAVGLFLGFLFIIKPGLGRLNNAKSEVSGLQIKVSSYQFILDGEKKIGEYKKLFSGDKTWLIEQLNSTAEKTGVSILSILPEETKRVGDILERASVRIDAECTYHQLGEFISRAESLPAYVKVLGIDINAEKNIAMAVSAPGWQQQGTAPAVKERQKSMDTYQISMSIAIFNSAAGAL